MLLAATPSVVLVVSLKLLAVAHVFVMAQSTVLDIVVALVNAAVAGAGGHGLTVADRQLVREALFAGSAERGERSIGSPDWT